LKLGCRSRIPLMRLWLKNIEREDRNLNALGMAPPHVFELPRPAKSRQKALP
jgi:hypothetical protein